MKSQISPFLPKFRQSCDNRWTTFGPSVYTFLNTDISGTRKGIKKVPVVFFPVIPILSYEKIKTFVPYPLSWLILKNKLTGSCISAFLSLSRLGIALETFNGASQRPRKNFGHHQWSSSGGETHQMKWCGWAIEIMKTSFKNIVASIENYAKNIFPILKYLILN